MDDGCSSRTKSCYSTGTWQCQFAQDNINIAERGPVIKEVDIFNIVVSNAFSARVISLSVLPSVITSHEKCFRKASRQIPSAEQGQLHHNVVLIQRY